MNKQQEKPERKPSNNACRERKSILCFFLFRFNVLFRSAKRTPMNVAKTMPIEHVRFSDLFKSHKPQRISLIYEHSKQKERKNKINKAK